MRIALCVYAFISIIIVNPVNGSSYSTIGKAWQSLKAELRHRSEAHGKFTEKVHLHALILHPDMIDAVLL